MPKWYDAACLATSLVFASLASVMYSETLDDNWLIVLLSGTASALLRLHRLKRTCDLGWGWLCSPSSSVLFLADLVFALLSISVFRNKVDSFTANAVMGMMVVSWYLYFVCKRTTESCVIHIGAHVAVCGCLAGILRDVRDPNPRKQ